MMMTLSKYFRPAAVIALVVASTLLLGCDTNEPESESPDAELDLETLEAETEFGTLKAERIDPSYVTAMGEGQAIGVAFRDGDGDEDADRQVVVYVYERDDLAVLIGELDADGEATLQSGDLSDFDATVDLTIEDDVVSGTATFLEEEATPFTAEEASGLAGVCWADGTDQDPDVRGDWVVLADGRQWGCVCVPPTFSNPCCHLRS